MAVEVQQLYNEYAPNGSTDTFSFTFDIIEEEQITVVSGSGSPLVWTTYTQDVDYEVTMSGSPIEGPQQGDITWLGSPLPASGTILRIYRNTPVIRDTDYVQSLRAIDLDNDQDYQTHILQEMKNRTLQLDEGGNFFDAQGYNICGVGSPESCVLSKAQADALYLNVSGDSMEGELDMNGNILSNPLDPTDGTHVGDRDYNDARYVNVTGDTMTGDLNMDGNTLTSTVLTTGRSSPYSSATTGVIRLSAYYDHIAWRAIGDGANHTLGVDWSTNWLQYDSVDLVDVSTAQTLTNKTLTNPAGIYLNDMEDVTAGSPATNDTLSWNGSAWVPTTAVLNIEDLQNVTTGSPNTENDILQWSGSPLQWRNVTTSSIAGQITLNELQDVTAGSPVANDTLSWNGSAWVPTTAILNLEDLQNVVAGSPSLSDGIIWSGSAWVAQGIPAAADIGDIGNVTITSVTDNELLVWDTAGSPNNWINKTLTEANLYSITEIDALLAAQDELSEMDDVTITSVAGGEILMWDTTGSPNQWINRTLEEANIPGLSLDNTFTGQNTFCGDVYWSGPVNSVDVAIGSPNDNLGYGSLSSYSTCSLNDIPEGLLLTLTPDAFITGAIVNDIYLQGFSTSTTTFGYVSYSSPNWDQVANRARIIDGSVFIVQEFGEYGFSQDGDKNTLTVMDMGSTALQDVCWDGSSRIVMVGEETEIYYSDNKVTWTTVDTSSITNQYWYGCAHGNGTFVVVGGNGKVIYSTDSGVTWTAGTSGTAERLTAVAYDGSGTWVAGGQNGTLIYSTDDGATWSACTESITQHVNDVVYVGGKFMAAVNATGIHYSTDGITFSLSLSSITGWETVLYDGSTYYAIANNSVRTSTSGTGSWSAATLWSSITTPSTATSVTCAAYDGANFFIGFNSTVLDPYTSTSGTSGFVPVVMRNYYFKALDTSAVVTELDDLTDVSLSTPTNRNVLVANGTSWASRALVEADISDLGTYLTDITSESISDLSDTAVGSPATGDILYYNGTAWVNLAKGTIDQVLTINGSPQLPTWQDPAGTADALAYAIAFS